MVQGLTENQLDKYLCRICLEPLNLDMTSSACNDDCEELFCTQCVTDWLAKNQDCCPACRGQFKKKNKVNYKVRQAVEEIIIKCEFCE